MTVRTAPTTAIAMIAPTLSTS